MQNEYIDYIEIILESNACTRILPLFVEHREALAQAPAGQTFHHNFTGGLARHIHEMILFGLPVARALKTVDGEQVINTEEFINVCILHDLAKLQFYKQEESGVYTYVKHAHVLQEMVVQNMCAGAGMKLTDNEINALWLAEGGFSPLFGKVEATELAHLVHMSDLFSSQLLKPRLVADAVCPRCGGTMVRRNGSGGAFWGCSGYPECKHTTNIAPSMKLEERKYEHI